MCIRDSLESDSKKTPKTLDAFYQIIEDTFHEYEGVKGLALSLPGAVDSETGIIGGSSALDYIHGPNIKEELEKRLQVRVEMENDANCAASVSYTHLDVYKRQTKKSII